MADKNWGMQISNHFKNLNYKQEAKNLFLLLLGSFIAASAINLIYIPFRISMGGVSGLAQILHVIIGENGPLTLGTLSMLLNIPILLLGWRYYGFRMVYRSVLGTLVFSFMIDFTAFVLKHTSDDLLEMVKNTPDRLVFAIFAGVIFGIGLGIIFRGHYTTGGSDILAVLATKYLHHITIGQFLFAFDLFVISMHVLTFSILKDSTDILSAMYALIALFLTSRLTDAVLVGTDSSRACFIISEKNEEIADKIMNSMNRGVTGLCGRGKWTKSEKEVLLVVLSNREVPDLKKLVMKLDERAFLIVTDAKEVAGEGFGSEDLI